MPQSFHVLRCYKCETFQVHIVKKSNKWECKICGDKQSVKKVFGEGTAKECRLHVQKLNVLRAETDTMKITHQVEEDVPQFISCASGEESKWSKFVDKVCDQTNETIVDNSVVADNDRVEYVLELPSRKRKVLKQLSNNNKAKRWKTREKCVNSEAVFELEENDLNRELIIVNKVSNTNPPSAAQWNQPVHNLNMDVCRPSSISRNGNSTINSCKIDMNSEITLGQSTTHHTSSNNMNKKQTLALNKPVVSSSKWAQYLDEPDPVDNDTDDSDYIPSHSLFSDHQPTGEMIISKSPMDHSDKQNVGDEEETNTTSRCKGKMSGIFELSDASNLDEIFDF